MTEGVPATRRILVATDFSSQANKALEWGRYLADHFPAKLVLLHVIEIFKLTDVDYRMIGNDPLGLLREQSQSSMAELKRLIPDSETHILEGSPRPLCRICAGIGLPDDRNGNAGAVRPCPAFSWQRCGIRCSTQQSPSPHHSHLATERDRPGASDHGLRVLQRRESAIANSMPSE
jgi:hypothetical protein